MSLSLHLHEKKEDVYPHRLADVVLDIYSTDFKILYTLKQIIGSPLSRSLLAPHLNTESALGKRPEKDC